MKPVRSAIIGIGGYGKVHTQQLLALADGGEVEIVAFCEVQPDANKDGCEQLRRRGAALYSDYRVMIERHPELELLVIASPIPLHREMALYAFSRGIHVMLEKPPAVTINDLDLMLEAQEASHALCQVNFQHTSSTAFRKLLDTLQEGAVGSVTDITGIGLWMRPYTYYTRNAWAGKLVHEGEYILDGTINNPFAHLLHNCLVACGAGDPMNALPSRIEAELYRANPIDGEDTSCLRIQTVSGITIHFYATLCFDKNTVPYLTVRGTKGELTWRYDNVFTARCGAAEAHYEGGEEDSVRSMYLNLLHAIRNPGTSLYCPLEACRSFVLSVNGAFEASGGTHPIPKPFTEERQGPRSPYTAVINIKDYINNASREGLLFSEAGVPWGIQTEPLPMKGYRSFSFTSLGKEE